MQGYLLIVSEDTCERRDLERVRDLALQLRRLGNPVTIFLVQNAVMAARASARAAHLPEVLTASVEVMADEFSLKERGIGANSLLAGVRCAPLGVVVKRLAGGWKTIWK
jgi:intracellular sulfur oxidation DsrE/DsrF family protein